MKNRTIFFFHFLAALGVLFVGGCTYYVPAKLETTRVGDTLTLSLSGPGSARWEPSSDSLVISCATCTPSREVEYFANANAAQYDIPATEPLTLSLYSMGTLDTLTLPGTVSETDLTSKPRITPRRYHEATAPIAVKTPAQIKAAQEKATERALQTTTILKVTAPEGVAIYRDKTRRQVLKILSQGSTIVLLAKEGDLYSVSIDGEEGFVDAEAVEIQK